jgi:hypothetical protein
MSAIPFDEVRSRIKEARRRVHVELRERSSFETAPRDDRAAADALTRSLGFRTLGANWVALSAGQGYQVAYEVLWRDLAYLEEIMDREAAEDLARLFLAHFDADARFFTNFICLDPTFGVGGNSEGWAVTEETAETGIIVVDQRRVGMLWVEDPD